MYHLSNICVAQGHAGSLRDQTVDLPVTGHFIFFYSAGLFHTAVPIPLCCDRPMSAEYGINPSHGPSVKRGNPSGCGRSGSADLPLTELNRDKVSRLEDSYLDSPRRRRDKGSKQIGSPERGVHPPGDLLTPPFNELEVPPAREKKAGRTSQIGRRGG